MFCFFVFPHIRHVHCGRPGPLVKAWVILDRPPDDPLLRKKEPFTSSLQQVKGSKEAIKPLTELEDSIPVRFQSES